MDTLSHILKEFEVNGSVYFCDILKPPWEIPVHNKTSGSFHCVKRGECKLRSSAGVEWLHSGDVVLVLKGVDHVVSSAGGSESFAKDDENHLLMCGTFNVINQFSLPLFQNFPRVLVIKDDEIKHNHWLKITLDYMISESQSQSPGANFAVDRLTEVLLIQFLRQYLKTTTQDSKLIAALHDPQISKSLNLMYECPNKKWTIEKLAQSVGMSRASFSNRFTKLVGESTYAYLTGIRMRKACHLLKKSDLTILSIAEEIGYLSDTAFNRAFRRFSSQSALKYRQSG